MNVSFPRASNHRTNDGNGNIETKICASNCHPITDDLIDPSKNMAGTVVLEQELSKNANSFAGRCQKTTAEQIAMWLGAHRTVHLRHVCKPSNNDNNDSPASVQCVRLSLQKLDSPDSPDPTQCIRQSSNETSSQRAVHTLNGSLDECHARQDGKR